MRRALAVIVSLFMLAPAASEAGSPVPVALMKLTPIATLSNPLTMASRAGDDTLYVVEQQGTIRAIRGGQVDPVPVLDLRGQVSRGFEQGLLGLAFPADEPDLMYINYTDLVGTTRIVEYDFTGGQVDLSTRRELLSVAQPFANHNGGSLEFGPDGYLYIGLGDGGSAGDPQRHAQNLGSLLGKMLRIDPRGGVPYAIPSDNPFVGVSGARPEIWAYGLRNPWKYTFDRVTGDLWIGDVGQSLWEEIDFQPAGSSGGQNYGWNPMEGTRPYQGGTEPANHTPPVYEYSHAQGCSVTGGYVYRGTKIPSLFGTYLFSDWCAGRIWSLAGAAGTRIALDTGLVVPSIAAFGQDNSGELYALSLTGPVFRVDPLL